MAPTAATKREYLRRLYRVGASANARSTWLDGLSDIATSQQAAGKTLIQATGEGFSSQYLAFTGWVPDDVLGLIDWLRGYVDAEDIDAALALLPAGRVTRTGLNFQALGYACNR